MKVLEVRNNYSKYIQYVLIDGNKSDKTLYFPVSMKCFTDNDKYVLELDYNKYKFLTNKKENNEFLVEEVHEKEIFSDKVSGLYTLMKYDYLKGVINETHSYFATVYESNVLINKLETNKEYYSDFGLLELYLLIEDYDKANSLLNNIMSNNNMNEDLKLYHILARMYEYGKLYEKDLDMAYAYYLMSKSYDDLLRFYDMGYAKNMNELIQTPYTNGFNERAYLFNSLLLDTCFKEIGLNKILKYASFWFFDEDELKDKEYINERKYLALSQLKAVNLILENNLIESNLENIINYLAGYFLWKKKGNSSDIVAIRDEDLGDQYDHLYVKKEVVLHDKALEFVRKLADSNNELAVKVLEEYNKYLGNK